MALAVAAALAIGASGCTRTHDLAAPIDQTTTTERVPVRRVPRATTTTTTIPTTTTAPVEVQAATTTVPPARPATGSTPSRRSTTATTTPLAALLGAALRIASLASATTVPPPPQQTAPTTTTTIIPANPAGIVVTAQNAVVHQGETQTIAVDNDNNPAIPSLATCAGRDYQPAGSGWVAVGFASPVACAVDGDATTLTRTLPANVPFGQYMFCTEVAGPTATTVCTAYVVVPYPT